MVKKFNLSEAAKDILNASVASKRGGQEGSHKLSGAVAYGTKEVGDIGTEVTKPGDAGPDATKGVPSATPPGATPPVGSEPAKHLEHQPGESEGRNDLDTDPTDGDATSYENIRDRIAGKKPKQTMEKNPGATFDSYDGVKEDIDAILAGEDLSEEFKTRAATVYEAAVTSRVSIIAEEIEAKLTEQFDVAVEQVKEEFSEKVDDYLNYMVTEWMSENQLAIESGLRSEIVEEFMAKLHTLFVESYIDIPEDKVNVVEELAVKVDDLEEQLNTEIQRNIEMKKEINEHKKNEVLYTVSEGLTQTQIEKLVSLAEGVDFTTEDEFAGKMETIKESFFGSKTIVTSQASDLNEGVEVEEEKTKPVSQDPSMDMYTKSISKSLTK
jgi:hypothetical protein